MLQLNVHAQCTSIAKQLYRTKIAAIDTNMTAVHGRHEQLDLAEDEVANAVSAMARALPR